MYMVMSAFISKWMGDPMFKTKVHWKLLEVVQFIVKANNCIDISGGEIYILFW